MLTRDVVKKKKRSSASVFVWCLIAWQPQGHCGAQRGAFDASINRVMVSWRETDGGHDAQRQTVTHMQEFSTLNYI